jgi:hypothetical protein
LVVGSYYNTKYEGQDKLYIVFNLVKGNPRPYTWRYYNDLKNIESIAIGDFDNDGRQNDIAVCNLKSVVITLSSIQPAPEDETFQAKVVENIMYEKPQSIIRGRFNNDELDDLALVSSQSDTLQVLLAYGDGSFIRQIYSIDRHPTAIARINFNNDSINDLAILTCHQTISIYLGTNLGVFDRSDILIHTGETNNNKCAHSLKVADFNQDKKDDLVFIDPEAKTVRVLLSTNCKERN